MKKWLLEGIGNLIDFDNVDKKQIVYCNGVNQCKYTVATWKSFLCDEYIFYHLQGGLGAKLKNPHEDKR